jgi:hypothetical protein
VSAVAEVVERVRRAIAVAPASHVVEALLAELGEAAGVTEAELLLVDYRMAALVPLGVGPDERDSRAIPPGGRAWLSFDQQQVVDDGETVLVPVSVRGDRRGVLRLGPTRRLDPIRTQLPALGDLLAHELAAANPATDRYLASARTRRLTLAAEMQWESLPGRCLEADEFVLAGQLEPAYAVKGDIFDWSVDAGRLSIALIDGMGEGVAAASLSILAVNALRNARRAGLDLVDQAVLADGAIYAEHRGERYVSALLIEIDLGTGVMSLVDMGSPVLMLARGGEVTELSLDRHDPLGMFDGSRYAAQRIQLAPGDRLVAVSDGVHTVSAGGRHYGGGPLRRLVGRTRGMVPLDVVRTLVGELRAFVTGELDDDAAVVCLDWARTW